jgi:4,5-DOPA dioxygenase extradiol
VECDNSWGLDHGAWTILKHLYPAADIPVFQLSVNYQFNHWTAVSLDYHFNVGKQLSELRKQGVLIIGSGNIVHNLGMVDFDDIDAKPIGWAKDVDEKVKEALINRDYESLINYKSLGDNVRLAVPTLDHYLPMIYVLGLQEEDDPLRFTYEGFHYGSLSMRCFQIG